MKLLKLTFAGLVALLLTLPGPAATAASFEQTISPANCTLDQTVDGINTIISAEESAPCPSFTDPLIPTLAPEQCTDAEGNEECVLEAVLPSLTLTPILSFSGQSFGRAFAVEQAGKVSRLPSSDSITDQAPPRCCGWWCIVLLVITNLLTAGWMRRRYRKKLTRAAKR